MKIKLKHRYNNWRYNIYETAYNQTQYDYIFKHLDFEELDKDFYIYFNNKQTETLFHKTYKTNHCQLYNIYENSPLGYEWLKNNWGKSVFFIICYYPDKKELKTIINKVINIELLIWNKLYENKTI